MKNILVATVLSLSMATNVCAQVQPAIPSDARIEKKVESLLKKMTLEEKIGQLNLPSGGDITTGTVKNGELSEMIRKQEIGGFFNVKGIDKIYELQRLAVEESRLKIPLLVGADVIHGYETIFPIPLALSCSWDTLAVEKWLAYLL